jgi:hypothetical protein
LRPFSAGFYGANSRLFYDGVLGPTISLLQHAKNGANELRRMVRFICAAVFGGTIVIYAENANCAVGSGVLNGATYYLWKDWIEASPGRIIA